MIACSFNHIERARGRVPPHLRCLRHGYVRVRASVLSFSSLSAHADYGELLSWLHSIAKPPQRTFVTHWEPAAADAMRRHIEETYHWRCEVPTHLETVELPGAADQHAATSCVSVAD